MSWAFPLWFDSNIRPRPWIAEPACRGSPGLGMSWTLRAEWKGWKKLWSLLRTPWRDRPLSALHPGVFFAASWKWFLWNRTAWWRAGSVSHFNFLSKYNLFLLILIHPKVLKDWSMHTIKLSLTFDTRIYRRHKETCFLIDLFVRLSRYFCHRPGDTWRKTRRTSWWEAQGGVGGFRLGAWSVFR